MEDEKIILDEQAKEDKPKKKKKEQKIRVMVRAVKYRIHNPLTKATEIYYEGDEISPVWPELVELAEKDTGHRALVLIK